MAPVFLFREPLRLHEHPRFKPALFTAWYAQAPPSPSIPSRPLIFQILTAILLLRVGNTKLGGDVMPKKYTDRTSEWSKQQQILKEYIKKLSDKTTDNTDKKHN